MAASFASFLSWQQTLKVMWRMSMASKNAGASPESMAQALPAARQLSMPLGSLLPQQAHLESLPEGISAGSLQAAPGISC